MSGPSQDDYDMMRRSHEQALWTNFAIVALGIWLATTPAIAPYDDRALVFHDVIIGILISVLGLLSISYERGWARWSNCGLGLWLLVSPYVFWAPRPIAVTTEVLIGALVIAFSILVPGMPGMRMEPGPTTPPGWSYNPSSWEQRAPVIGLALAAFFMSRYLGAHQLGHIDHAWDPFFGDGTRRVLNSSVSRAWPVSDAGFGAASYMIEALSGFMGGRDRWRTMPWMVLMFGVLVIPLGITSIVLVILQPVMVGHWCALCLGTALLMLVMIPLAVDEVIAMAQFMAKVRRDGKPFWLNFWRGGTPGEHVTNEDMTSFHVPAPELSRTMVRGVTAPPNLVLATFLGFWLMAAPALFGPSGATATNAYLVGPLIAVIAVCATAEVIRSLRFVLIPTAIWLFVAPFILEGGTTASAINGIAVGLILVVASLPRGLVLERYADWRRWTR